MKLKNLRIGALLQIGFGLMLLFAALLGWVAFQHTNKMYQQNEILYEHPMKVKQAVSLLHSDIYMIHWCLESMFMKDDIEQMGPFIAIIEKHENSANECFQILFDAYLGPQVDVEELFSSFNNCRNNRHTVIDLIEAGHYEKAKMVNIHEHTVVTSDHLNVLVSQLEKIRNFSDDKADQLNKKSFVLKNTLQIELLILVIVIFLTTIFIYYVSLRYIRKPVSGLTGTALLYRDGNYNARNNYQSNSELGQLSAVFNSLADNIQQNLEINRKINEISTVMISEDDATRFFQNMLRSLASLTGSQMAAVYLRSDNLKRFEHFESLGLDEGVVKSFEIENFTGEFGPAIASRKIQIIKNIPENTRFTYLSVTGRFVPNEIITIPVVAGNDILAVISLASLNEYSPMVMKFIEKFNVTLCTRVAGIMAYRKMKEFSEMLEQQNTELMAQKSELSAQSVELIQQNNELEIQKKQLDEASRIKTNFLSNMSHELRTPLNSVIALSGVLNRRLANKIPADEYSYIEVIERNGKHLLSLINDILDISRIEAGREEIDITTFDVNRLIMDVIGLVEPQATQKGIDLIHANADNELYIASDSGKVLHILQNLIGNGVKFTEKGFVRIQAVMSEDLVKISVQDTGIGISKENITHIFDEFRQADGSTSRRFGGTGLGLSIAKKYTNLLGGNITVKSIPGEGSEFVLSLPAGFFDENHIINHEYQSISRFSRIKPPDKYVKARSGKSILLVEDSEPAIIQMKDILEEKSFTVSVARSGHDALSQLENVVPDAIILDLMMPGIDGFEVLKNIRSRQGTATIPVLILTAKHITKEDLKILKGNNIFELIQKGDVNRDELLNVVFAMINQEKDKKKEIISPIQRIEGKPVVLIVEDNPDNMLTAKAVLDNDFTIIEAVNGNEGVDLARQFVPNLILMDIALPEMDGIQAFKIIRNEAQLQHIPIIALTASAMTTDREVILAHGFNAYISKPIDEKEFFKTIKMTLYGK